MNYKKYLAKKINLKNFKIHELSKTFIVAEISANHGGNIKNIFKSIDFIKKIGADAIKIQSYEASTITLNSKTKMTLFRTITTSILRPTLGILNSKSNFP